MNKITLIAVIVFIIAVAAFIAIISTKEESNPFSDIEDLLQNKTTSEIPIANENKTSTEANTNVKPNMPDINANKTSPEITNCALPQNYNLPSCSASVSSISSTPNPTTPAIRKQEIPEFPSIIFPLIGIFAFLFYFRSKKGEEK
jgi:hypothetical protein